MLQRGQHRFPTAGRPPLRVPVRFGQLAGIGHTINLLLWVAAPTDGRRRPIQVQNSLRQCDLRVMRICSLLHDVWDWHTVSHP